jgi:hypothetical protein
MTSGDAATVAAWEDLPTLRAALRWAGEPATAAEVDVEIKRMLAVAPPNTRPAGDEWAKAVMLDLTALQPSRGAIFLGFADVRRDNERRRFHPIPHGAEIFAAVEKAAKSLAAYAEAADKLATYAESLPALIAREQASAEAADRRARRSENEYFAAIVRGEFEGPIPPDRLPEVFELIAAEDAAAAEREAKRQRVEAEREASAAGRAAERQQQAEGNRAAIRAEVAKRIGAGQFALAQAAGSVVFAELADAFAADPDAAPETVAALAAFRRPTPGRSGFAAD